MKKFFAGAVGFLALVVFALMFSYTIDQQERGVLLRNGAVTGMAQPGRGYKLPIIDRVVKIPVNHQTISWSGEAALKAYSNDQQPADIAISVVYQVPPDRVMEVYTNYGGLDGVNSRLLSRVVPQEVKTVFGQFVAVTAIQERARMNRQIMDAIAGAVKNSPISIVAVTVENIDFSEAYEKSIEARMLAEVEVTRARQIAQQEKIKAEIAVTQAQGRAESALAEAKAAAEATRIKGEAEAAAIKARGDALQANPGLVALTAAEKWDGKLPNSMVPNGALPFISVETTKNLVTARP